MIFSMSSAEFVSTRGEAAEKTYGGIIVRPIRGYTFPRYCHGLAKVL